ncbi:phasin family protein [Sphingomonas beigongshangi]|uniref:phasin family protein n=1 Tax=Sphingomonas beigongshangi TaxID=2782540 RepID=UPI001FED3F52|nr:phasin family protein [Sphingomonas beigongshangi]
MADEETPTGADQAGRAADAMRDITDRWADRWREAGDRARDSFGEHVVDPARRAGEAMRASGRHAAEGSQAIGLKMLKSAERNTREAFAAMREAAQARDLAEVMRIQGQFLRGQGERAFDQAREIGELIVRIGRESVAAPRAEHPPREDER